LEDILGGQWFAISIARGMARKVLAPIFHSFEQKSSEAF